VTRSFDLIDWVLNYAYLFVCIVPLDLVGLH
jgi:hypothetical protein